MPRQLDKATNDDVVQANGTLNTFLAGRTKSWMTSGGNPVRPTPRAPPKVAVPVPSQIATTTATTTATTQSMSNVLLSPTPSIEEAIPRPQSPQNGNNPRNMQNQNSNSPRTTSNQIHDSTYEGSDNGQNRLAANHRPLPWGPQGGPQAAPRQPPSPIPSSTAPGYVVHTSTAAMENPGQGQDRVDTSMATLNNMARTQSTLQVPTRVQTAPIPQIQHDQPHDTPHTPHLPLPSTIIQSRSRASSGTPTSSYSGGHQSTGPIANPPKRQRTHPPAMPSLKPRVALIHQYISSVGGAQALSALLERPRFALLEQACIEEDAFYLSLHQVFCVWDLNNQSLPNIYQFPAPEILTTGFRILGQLIKSNSGLKLNHLQWFANFPSPLIDLLQTSEPYRRTMDSSCNFLFKLGNEWDRLSERCRNRGYPPVVDELVETLGCLSPILQQIIFTASRRNLGFEDDSYGPRMEEVFRLDKSGHKSLAQRYHTASPPTEIDIIRRNADVIKNFQQVIQQRLQTRQQAQLDHARRVPGRNSLSNEHINPSSWNSVQQNRPRVPHPAPISVASRSSNGQVAASSPSPTFMQNLSMNPPNQPGQYVQYPYPPANMNEEHQPFSPQAGVQNSGQVQMQPMTLPQYNQYQTNALQHQQVVQQQQNIVTQQQQQHIMAQQQQLQRNHRNTMRPTGPQLPQDQRVSQQNGNFRPFNPSRTRASQPAPPLRSNSKVHHPVDIYNKTHPLDRSLIPPAGFVQPAQPINPGMTALHQAHLRSPKLVPADLGNGGRFYQTIKELVIEPVKIPFDKPFKSFQFTIDPNELALLAKDKSTFGDKLGTRFFKQGTTQYRFRCIRTNEISNICTISEWTISDTMWPETIYAELNKKALEIRRKNLHGKDLPIDITGILSEKNQLRLSIPQSRTGHAYFFFAIECVEILQHDQILEMCSRNRIPLDTTMASIRKSMSTSHGDDDDIEMVITDLSIDLADPFTARIFDVPVRSIHCLHRECFDLETFLQTRNPKPKRPKQPCMVDQWKCPLCGMDARPYNLRIDDFLLSVRARLAEEANLEVKAILVSANGEWRPKPLPQPQHKRGMGEVSHDSDSDDENAVGKININRMPRQGSTSGASAVRARESAPQVIELDSD